MTENDAELIAYAKKIDAPENTVALARECIDPLHR